MTTNSDTVMFYFDDDLVRVPRMEAMDYLRQFETFTVFVSFMHPVADRLVREHAICYPNPQKSYGIGNFGAWCFLTEVQGLMIRIPADLDWFSDQPSTRRHVTQGVSFLKQGEINTTTVEVNFMPTIRTPGQLRGRQSVSP